MKFIKKYWFLFFVASGSIINFVFYIKFFRNTNYDPWVYWIISATFTGATALLYFKGFQKHKPKIIFCAICISIFSIFCSTAGQFADSQKKIISAVESAQEITSSQATTAYLWEQVRKLDKEWADLDAEKRATIQTAEDRYNWKNTTAAIEKRQAENVVEKKRYEAMLFMDTQDESDDANNTEYSSDIFDQITRNIVAKIWLMLIFEICLSIIIELVAPLALYLMTIEIAKVPHYIREGEKNISAPIKKEKSFAEYVDIFIKAAWPKNGESILSGRPAIMRQVSIPHAIYHRIILTAKKRGLIKIERKKTVLADPFLDKAGFREQILRGKIIMRRK